LLFWSLPIGIGLIVPQFKEGNHARQLIPTPFPAKAIHRQRLALNRLWEVLPEQDRQRTLQLLSRLVAQQLQPPPDGAEVPDEDD
jgi:hypothetical protein